MLLVALSLCPVVLLMKSQLVCVVHVRWKWTEAWCFVSSLLPLFFFCFYSISRNKLVCKLLHQKFCIVTCTMSAVKTGKMFFSSLSAWCQHVREKRHNLFVLYSSVCVWGGGNKTQQHPVWALAGGKGAGRDSGRLSGHFFFCSPLQHSWLSSQGGCSLRRTQHSLHPNKSSSRTSQLLKGNSLGIFCLHKLLHTSLIQR